MHLVITWLLQHEPQKRPTAYELSQTALLPARLEDEYFKGALRLMGELSLVWCNRTVAHADAKQNLSPNITKLFLRPCSSNLPVLPELLYTIWMPNNPSMRY